MTIDKLLLKIVNFTSPTIEELIIAKDARVLRSLASSVGNHSFITENQSKLLMKILRENSEKMPEFKDEILQEIDNPTWSRSFRQI